MTTDPFELLIKQLGGLLHIPLHVDHNHACAIKVRQQIVIQLQLDAAQEHLLIGSLISELPPGKFRENVLCEARKANNQPDPRAGILGYLSQTNRLTMHQRYPLTAIDGEKLALLVGGFSDYAELWYQALQQGETSPAPSPPPSPFR